MQVRNSGQTDGFGMSQAIETLRDGLRGLSLLMQLNGDRLLFPFAIALALMLGGWLTGL